MKKYILFFSLIATVLLVSGCTTFDPTAFNPEKRYAVISTFMVSKIDLAAGVHVQDDEKKAVLLKSNKIINQFVTNYLAGFKRHTPFKVTYGRKVTSTNYYRRLKFKGNTGVFGAIEHDFVTASGYKRAGRADIPDMGKHARALGYDGVIIVYHQVRLQMYGSSRSGQLAPYVKSIMGAYDRMGKEVMLDIASYEVPETLRVKDGKVYGFDKTYQLLLNHAEDAGRYMADRINNKLKAK